MTQPIRRFQAGACSASIFANEIRDGAKGRHFHSVSLQRVYKDKTGAFRYTASLRREDLADAIRLLEQAQAFLRANDRQSQLVSSEKPKNI